MILKIDTLYLLFVLLNLLKTTNAVPPDLTFIVKTNDSGYINPLCIGESDVLTSAVTWIYPIPDTADKLPTIVSKYVPQRSTEYNCNFGKTKKCNTIWHTLGWQLSTFDFHNFKPIIDSRWESFSTYLASNSTKEYDIRIDIPNVFEVGFSIRASKNAEILICDGWTPKLYSCYYLNIGAMDNKQIFFRKYENGIPDKFSKTDTKLAKFKSNLNILSEEEWKTFSLSLSSDGVLSLKDCFNGATVLNYTDKAVLKPTNFIVRSKSESSLWKFHKNDFIFTNKTGILKLGPEIQLYGTRLCISLYTIMCTECRIKFFIKQNGTKEILKEITKSDGMLWMEIKLKKEKIYDESVQVYVEADYAKESITNGFWAIDDVRVCIPNELKVTYLNLNMSLKDFQKTHVTCQSLKHPNWRPIHHLTSTNLVAGVTCNASTSVSVKCIWKPTTDDKSFEEYSIVQYEGMDICKYDKNLDESILNCNLRKKSQGYVIDKNNEIEVIGLIPYTSYNITFWNVIDGFHHFFEINTLPTDIPTKEELPRIVKMSTTDTYNEISWNKPKCNETYGPVIYQLSLKVENGNYESYFVDIVAKYKFNSLQPFTAYNLEIRTARRIENLNSTNLFIRTIYNFTTKPGIAVKVENLELYSTSKGSASLRYNLPKQPRGRPKLVQIRWCHPLFLGGCLFEINNLTKCALWDFKYCIDVPNLVKGNEYSFSVGIKNEDTSSFGEEVTVNGTAIERVPGKPANISYKMVNCNHINGDCSLNITWMHPYNQNATITMFDVILNETSFNFVGDALKRIHEVVKVKKYQNTYNCIITYITNDVPYKLLVRAVNDIYRGEFEEILIKTNNPENYIDQTPKYVECTNETMKFELPKLSRRLSSSTLILIVQDYDKSIKYVADDVVKLEMFGNKYKLCNEFGDTWVAKTVNLSTTDKQLIVVGDRSSSYIPQLNKTIINKLLNPNTEYCFTFAIINQDENSETITVYHSKHLYTQRNSMTEKHQIESNEEINAAIYLVPIIVFIGLFGCVLFLLKKYLLRRHRINGEHIYESMPFDDYVPDAVSNENYDRLVHK